MNKLIGNTPMIKINYKYLGKENSIFTKLEYYNLTGSIKDRIVYYMLKEAKANNSLKSNQPIIEVTSGNTGISLSAIGTFFKHEVHIFMPDYVSKERQALMKQFGAKLYLVSREEGGFKKCFELAKEKASEINGFLISQFENETNVKAHYDTTGMEIINQVDNIGGFVSGIGTGGTLMGIAKKLKEYDKDIKIYALEPDSLPILSNPLVKGTHKIEGIGDDFIPKIVKRSLIDEIILINDNEAITMAKKLAKDLGLGVGISSGANFLASVIAKANNEKNIVTIFADDNKKYLSTDLVKEMNKESNITNKIELLSYEVAKFYK